MTHYARVSGAARVHGPGPRRAPYGRPPVLGCVDFTANRAGIRCVLRSAGEHTRSTAEGMTTRRALRPWFKTSAARGQSSDGLCHRNAPWRWSSTATSTSTARCSRFGRIVVISYAMQPRIPVPALDAADTAALNALPPPDGSDGQQSHRGLREAVAPRVPAHAGPSRLPDGAPDRSSGHRTVAGAFAYPAPDSPGR